MVLTFVDVLAGTVVQHIAGRTRAGGFVAVDNAGATAAVDIVAWICNLGMESN